MKTEMKNPFLAAVMHRVRSTRPRLPLDQPFFNRVERVPAGNYVELWFLTRGCTWDHQGGCTMCNYGRGPERSESQIVDAVRSGLAAIDVPVAELLVSPSGGMLDPIEVPVAARRGIYELVRDFPTGKFMIETRAETVGEEEVIELQRALPDRELAVELGLESSCPWIQRFCVNRGQDPEVFSRAAALLVRHGIGAYGNVSLGSAFLSPAEAIADAVRTIRWGFAQGATAMVLFPLHVKPHTLLSELHARGRYSAPSLWSLVEVLSCLEPEIQVATEIAWYKSYYDKHEKTSVSPGTCPRCAGPVMRLLDEYRETLSRDVVERLHRFECPCRDSWRRLVETPATASLAGRVLEHYRELADRFRMEGWWAQNGEQLEHALFAGAPEHALRVH